MTKKRLNNLDNYLRRELSESPAGGPMFRWLHSESRDLLHPMVVPGEFSYHCPCGTNVRVHKPQCKTSLTVASPRISFRKVCPSLNDQWLIAKWHAPSMSEKVFNQRFGGQAVYPRRGFYMPVAYAGPRDEGCPTRYIALDPGVEPNRQVTERFAGQMKVELEKRFHELVKEGEEIVARAEKKSSADLADKFDNLVQFPFNKVPGKRGGSTVVPDPVLQAKGDASPALIQP